VSPKSDMFSAAQVGRGEGSPRDGILKGRKKNLVELSVYVLESQNGKEAQENQTSAGTATQVLALIQHLK